MRTAPTVFRDPHSRATATAAVDGTRALGIGGAGGANTLRNEGSIVGHATPTAEANAYADYGSDILSIDSFATTSAEVSRTEAIGLLAAGTRAEVCNAKDATIDVPAQPLASVFSDAKRSAPTATSKPGLRRKSRAQARPAFWPRAGRETKVVNEGLIKVTTDARAKARSLVDPGWGGEIDAFVEDTEARFISATGIAGFGDANTLRNHGSQ